jgi:hypothetical protein
MAKLPAVWELAKLTLGREGSTPTQADAVIFFLGGSVEEDFQAIQLLCGNGLGIAATKLLRGMYERVVTLGYLSLNSNEGEAFVDYGFIHRMKHWRHLKALIGSDAAPEVMTESELNDLTSSYNAVLPKFTDIVCKTCKTTETRFSWSKLGVDAMAKKLGPKFSELYLQCYFEPTLQGHPTMSAIFSRLDISAFPGKLSYKFGPQRDDADSALMLAHQLALLSLEALNQHSKLGLDSDVQQCFRDYEAVWQVSLSSGSSTSK